MRNEDVKPIESMIDLLEERKKGAIRVQSEALTTWAHKRESIRSLNLSFRRQRLRWCPKKQIQEKLWGMLGVSLLVELCSVSVPRALDIYKYCEVSWKRLVFFCDQGPRYFKLENNLLCKWCLSDVSGAELPLRRREQGPFSPLTPSAQAASI